MTEWARTLYPDWTGPKVVLPNWVSAYGLSRNRMIVQRVYASSGTWQQAVADGLENISPIIVLFNLRPGEIKQTVGTEAWKKVHNGSLKANVDRLVLKMCGGWTFEEALLFPTFMRRRAKRYFRKSKTAVLSACRNATSAEDFEAQLIMAEDFQRMGGQLDQSWGRKRLRKEHDARAMERVIKFSDPEPWSKAWFFDHDGYSFSLLKSEAELALEAALQRHCVGSYAHACRQGQTVVLRVEGRERATCSWTSRDSHLQVAGKFNRKVSPGCQAAASVTRAAYLKHKAQNP